VLDPRSKSYGANIVQDIVGAPDYAAGRGLAGVSAEGDELVVRLTRPAPDLVSRLASPWFCAVPPETPVTLTGSSLIPTAGPYYVESYDPGKSIVLRRNPNYDGPRPAELEQIDYELGVPPERAIERVESGTADYYSNRGLGQVIPAPDVARLDARYGPGSEAARAGAQRFFLTTDPAVHYLVFNTHRPPFDDARVRRAVNFAIDRRALAREPFPDVTGRPTDQFLPPGLAGFSDQANYPLGRPDVAHARQLAGDLDASAVLYTCNQPACDRLGQVVSRDLARIGIDVEVRQFAAPELFDRVDARGEPFDLGQTNYFADYADPFNFVNFLFQPGLGLHGDLFEDPALTAEMERAATLTGDERYRAYAELDRELSADAAVGVPYASGTVANLFSARIGCQVDQPVYGIDLGRLCVR